MKTTNRTLTTLMAILLFAMASAQTTVILDYMHVDPGKRGMYLEVEEEWKKIHQARVDHGMISAWEHFEVMYAGAESPYHYVTVSVFEDYNKTEDSYPWEWIKENYTEAQRNALLEKTGESRTLVRTEVYFRRVGAGNSADAKYLLFHRMKVNPGMSSEYKKVQEEVIKPVFEEIIDRGGMSSWSSWDKFLAGDDFDIVTVDEYNEFGQWRNRWPVLEESFKQVFPDKDLDATGEKIMSKRTHYGSSELWKYVDKIVAPSEE